MVCAVLHCRELGDLLVPLRARENRAAWSTAYHEPNCRHSGEQPQLGLTPRGLDVICVVMLYYKN